MLQDRKKRSLWVHCWIYRFPTYQKFRVIRVWFDNASEVAKFGPSKSLI